MWSRPGVLEAFIASQILCFDAYYKILLCYGTNLTSPNAQISTRCSLGRFPRVFIFPLVACIFYTYALWGFKIRAPCMPSCHCGIFRPMQAFSFLKRRIS